MKFYAIIFAMCKRNIFYLYFLLFLLCVAINLCPAQSVQDSYGESQADLPKSLNVDNKMTEEEKRLRSKRTKEQNAIIDEAVEDFYATVQNIDFGINDEDEKVQEQIDNIENYKQILLFLQMAEDTDTTSTEQELKTDLKRNISALEERSLTTSSLTGILQIKPSIYSTKNMGWTIEVRASAFGVEDIFNIEVLLPYSAFTGTAYTKPSSMTSIQKEDYENNIMIFDSFFRQGVPLVYARLTYRIQKWKNASEYRFVPQECKIYRTDRNRVITTVYSQNMKPAIFNYSPETEIRTNEEIEEDNLHAENILKEEEALNKLYNQAMNGGQTASKSDSQKGRSALFISVDTLLNTSDFSKFDIRDVYLNSICANFCITILKYGFVGGEVGYDYDKNERKSSTYALGTIGGITYTLCEYARVFAQATLLYHTNFELTPRLGAGVDFIAGKIMLTIGYNYQFCIDLYNAAHDNMDAGIDITTGHIFYMGFGLTI